MNSDDTKRALAECKQLTQEYKSMQLYMHGVHQDFLQLNNLSKLEAVSGGSAEALTKMEGDLEYYKDLFEKYKFNYIEQDTKEKFLKEILQDSPPEITLASNNELEAKNAENKRLLDEKALAIEQLNREVMETVDAVCKENDKLEEDVVNVSRLLREMQDMEAEMAMLKSVEDKYSGMTVEDAQILLEEQTQSLYKVNQEMEEVEASIQDLKWKESQMVESNQKLARQSIQVEAQAKEAIRLSSMRRPEIEAAYKDCLVATKQYQEGVGLESIQILDDSCTLLLEYKVIPGAATVHSLLGANQALGKGSRSRKPVLVQFTIKFHPISGRILSAAVANAGCDLKDVVQVAKARNDVSFLVSEILDRVHKAHP
ncbi:hypothetical protein BGZ59_001777 [Podila verticillata]|nr:hypothetical protein BGZ59_001777 [Podila verticillata]KFH68687.1 hypothetical protein MVEG_05495 [Podila verticillata NRRL 6337]